MVQHGLGLREMRFARGHREQGAGAGVTRKEEGTEMAAFHAPGDAADPLTRCAPRDRFDRLGDLEHYDEAQRSSPRPACAPTPPRKVVDKTLASLEDAFDACNISDGATLSFHHHLRNGDGVLNAVMAIAARRGLSNLAVATSSIFPVHAPLVDHMDRGVVSRIATDYAIGPVADAVMGSRLQRPLILESHGGRARAIASGELPIDVAFVAAPRADRTGAATGALGRNACGPLGYAMVDADYARHVVVLTDELDDDRLERAEIAAERVDHVVAVPSIGDAAGIESGTTAARPDETARAIAALAADALGAVGAFRTGFSFQTGAGGASLLAAAEIGARLRSARTTGGFISGGITGAHVDLVREGLFREICDVQAFDLRAVASFRDDSWHRAISAAEYASPIHPAPIVDALDAVVLGAVEVDRDFNVNVTLGGDGRLIGGPGGHPDTAAGARLTVVTTRTVAGRYPKIVDRVACRTTPGQHVDLLVTERGVAVNPSRPDLARRLRAAGLPVVAIDDLIEPGTPRRTERSVDRARVVQLGRDGRLLDVI